MFGLSFAADDAMLTRSHSSGAHRYVVLGGMELWRKVSGTIYMTRSLCSRYYYQHAIAVAAVVVVTTTD